MSALDYHSPTSLSELYKIRGECARPVSLLAGGTDLLVQMKRKRVRPRTLVDLQNLEELRGLSLEAEEVNLGALVSMAELAASRLIRQKAGLLSEAAERVGCQQTRNLATVGGNVCNAAPSADTMVALLALGSRVNVVGPIGHRSVPLEEFVLAPGRVALDPGEVVKSFTFPALGPRSAGSFLKFQRRAGMDIATTNVAVVIELEANGTVTSARIALGAVAPTPIRALMAEVKLIGGLPDPPIIDEVALLAATAASPITDIRATAQYRTQIIKVLIRRALTKALNPETGLRSATQHAAEDG